MKLKNFLLKINNKCWIYLFDDYDERLWFGTLEEFNAVNNKAINRLKEREVSDFYVRYTTGVSIYVK